MSTRPKQIEFNPKQFKSIQVALGLAGTDFEGVSKSDFFFSLEVDEFKDDTSIYHMFGYKTYEPRIDPFWKKIRGVIIKDYTKRVCGSISATPNLTVNGTFFENLRDDNSMTLTEYLEKTKAEIARDDLPKKEKHTLSFINDEAKGYKYFIRPSFQGTAIRVWLSNGIVHYSSLRNHSVEKARWILAESDEDPSITFAQKFNELCGFGANELFAPGMRNSPFCHVFLMCTPQSTSHTHIDCGRGFIIYLKTEECYPPEDAAGEEQVNYLLTRIPEQFMTEADYQLNNEFWVDKRVFPLSLSERKDRLSRFIPRPTLQENIDDGIAAVYNITESMTLEEADAYLTRGVDDYSSNAIIAEMAKHYPLYLPGESLHVTITTPDGEQTFILSPSCVGYRTTMVRDVNNRQNQLMQLRDFASRVPEQSTIYPFTGMADDLFNKKYEDLCQLIEPKKGKPKFPAFYYGITNDYPEVPDYPKVQGPSEIPEVSADVNYSILTPPDGIVEYELDELLDIYPLDVPDEKKSSESSSGRSVFERKTYTNSRWFIVAYYYCLCLPMIKRQAGWRSFIELYEHYLETMEFIVQHYDAIVNKKSPLYFPETAPFAFANKLEAKKPLKEGLLAMEEIISFAKSAVCTERRLKVRKVVADVKDKVYNFPPLVVSSTVSTSVTRQGSPVGRGERQVASAARQGSPVGRGRRAPTEVRNTSPDRTVRGRESSTRRTASNKRTSSRPRHRETITDPEIIKENIRFAYRASNATAIYRMIKLVKGYLKRANSTFATVVIHTQEE
jgi:hypothetical protein